MNGSTAGSRPNQEGRCVILILTRKRTEQVVLDTSDGPVVVTVMDVDHGKVRLGFQAPASVVILRSELVKPEPPKES